MLPGKYAFNTFSGKVIEVPTTNFILKWESGNSGPTFDQNLKEMALITKDAFKRMLPLSVVVHIYYKKAARVVQCFGNIQQLIEQTLDPIVSAYFKNTAQTNTLIELLQERTDVQTRALADMRAKFAESARPRSRESANVDNKFSLVSLCTSKSALTINCPTVHRNPHRTSNDRRSRTRRCLWLGRQWQCPRRKRSRYNRSKGNTA